MKVFHFLGIQPIDKIYTVHLRTYQMKNFNQIHSCSVKVIRVLIRHSRISFAFGRNMWFVEQVLTRCKNHDWFTSSHATKYSVFNNLKHGGQGSHFPFSQNFSFIALEPLSMVHWLN